MKPTHKTKHILATALTACASLWLTSCSTTYPGGLTESEYQSLAPRERAKLKIQQERADSARMANIEQSMNRVEQRREFEQTQRTRNHPSIHLSDEETRAINALSSY